MAKHLIVSEIRSYTHRITQDAFVSFPTPDAVYEVLNIQPESFVFGICTNEVSENPEQFLNSGYFAGSRFLMALNLVTQGHFGWNDHAVAAGQFKWIDWDGKIETELACPMEAPAPLIQAPDLQKREVDLALGIAVVLMADADREFIREYLKGLVQLGRTFYDLEFRKEAFFNFYRIVENFCLQRVLRKRNFGGNEMVGFKDAFSKAGMDPGFIHTFETELYPIRCAQVGHAYRPQKQIDYFAARKMKLCADCLLLPHFLDVLRDMGEKI